MTDSPMTPSSSSYDPDRPPRKRILDWEAAKAFVATARADGRRVVMANGCFDLLHGGHVSYLESSREFGDALIVGINSDSSERELKGPMRPVVPDVERAELVAAVEGVDAVFIFDELTAERALRELRPDVHAKGTDYTSDTVPEREISEELGIEVAIAGRPKENTSKAIIKTARESGAASG